MAYPYSDTVPMGGFTPELDLSSLGAYGNPLAPANVPNLNAGIYLDSSIPSNQGLSNLMSGFSNLFSNQSLFGGTNAAGQQTTGWAMPAISLLSGVLGFSQNQKASKLAESQFKESKRQFDLNYEAQRKSLNTDLEDRQRARVASAGGSGAYESVDSYLQKNRI